MPALQIAIHQVVVQQREVVDEFDADRAGRPDLGGRSGRLRRQQCERRTDGFTPAALGRPAVGVAPPEVIGRLQAGGRIEALHCGL